VQKGLPRCPECGSTRVWKDGVRRTREGPIQRWLCRDCGLRFSESKNLKKVQDKRFDCRVGAGSNPAKNSAKAVQALKEIERELAAGTREPTAKAAVKSRIIAYLWHLKKLGRKPETLRNYGQKLFQLLNEGVDLLNPDSVKEYLSLKKSWGEASKHHTVVVYNGFAKFHGITWEKPNYKFSRKLPFIPLESEIDALIACSGKKISALLQLLKETGMRIGEALRLKWTDIDYKRNLIILNEPEKGSEPRIFKVSNLLISKLNKLPKTSEKIFGDKSREAVSNNFRIQRKRIANKLGNPRLLKISFHTLRHWKATMEYAKTRDILHVMQLLGHKNIKNTLIYTQLIKFKKEDEFHSAVAKTTEEARQLVENGFEYVCTTPEGIMLFRKRK